MLQSLYKQNVNRNERQEKRRRELLHQQKLKRLEKQDELRWSQESCIHEQKKRYHSKQKRNYIENIDLQLSEWLKEKPENLEDWLLVPCPKGKRCIVVSTKGETKMFSKNKKYRMSFSSLLPGAGNNGSNSNFCILDCIYNEDIEFKFFVLDALHFCIPLMDCDTEFRFFWLKSKFNEIIDQEDYKIDNLKKFELLVSYDMSDQESIAMALQSYPMWENNKPELDGFLFYHKHSHYVCGITPLVCWLFPFMLPEILQLPISKYYTTPSNYCKNNPWQYMDEFDHVISLKQRKKMKKTTELISYDESSCELATKMEEDEEIIIQNSGTEDWGNIR